MRATLSAPCRCRALVAAAARAALLVLTLLALPGPAAAAERGALADGQAQCERGRYHLAVLTLADAYRQAGTPAERAAAAGALGRATLQLRRIDEARRYLREARELVQDPAARARHALDLANLEAGQRDTAQAEALYDEALRLAPDDPALRLAVALNRVPLAPAARRLGLLDRAFADIATLPDAVDRAGYLLNLAAQARALGDALAARALAQAAATAAEAAAARTGDPRLIAGAQDALAQLLEDAGRVDEALALSSAAVRHAQQPAARDLLVPLEWRRGRLLAAQGRLEPAIAAYQRAVDRIEAVRQDIPVEYANGRSSFRDTLEPVYTGLADLLLRQAGALEGAAQARQLRRVRRTLESIKQTELEDFLGSRCALAGAGRGPAEAPVAAGTAVLYPVLLADRLELLVETADGIERRSVAIGGAALRQDATAFAAALRARRPFLPLARRLHDALLAPVADLLARQSIDTLVVVPDGALRLVPFAALHDGQRFAVERHAVAVVPAVTLGQAAAAPAPRPLRLLVAGVSAPGAVVDKLPSAMTAQLLAQGSGPVAGGAGDTRALFEPGASRNLVVTEAPTVPVHELPVPVADPAARTRALQARLALSGVVEEVGAIARLASATVLLNQDFSARAFGERVRSGEYSVVHVASHGVFGSTADGTFLLAHDELISIDQLQALLRGPALRRRPVDLLTLSACETAEGDDRAPLGLSGAALKAQAQRALGSLWPVSDVAATRLMGDFYRHLVQADVPTTARALQQAQRRMLGQPELQHPYYWAPFILVERRL